MTTQMVIRIDEELKARAAQIARMEGQSLSEVLRTLLERYVIEKDINVAFDRLWDKARTKMEGKGFTGKDVEKIIKQVRQDKK